MSDVSVTQKTVKTYQVRLSPSEITSIIKNHVYGLFGSVDGDVYDVSRGADAINFHGWEVDDINATLIQEL